MQRFARRPSLSLRHMQSYVDSNVSTIATGSRIYSNKRLGARYFSLHVRDMVPNAMSRAKALLDSQAMWSDNEIAQAIFLVDSLLNDPKRSAESVYGALQLVNRWIDDRGETSAMGPWRGIPNRMLSAIKTTEPVRVEDGLHLLNKLDSMPDAEHRPDTKAFSMVLSMLHASTGNAKTRAVAKDIFQRACRRGGGKDPRLWCAYLDVLAHCSIEDKEASNEAEEILEEMIQTKLADSNSASIVLHSLANSGRPDRALALLKRLIHEKEFEVRCIMFNTCINAYAKQGNGEQAEAVLRSMLAHGITPDSISFSSAMNAWAQSQHPDASERAEQLLIMMENAGYPLTEKSCTSLIVAWSKGRKPHAADRAIELLDSMEARYLQGEVQLCPSHFTYAAAIHALSKGNVRDSADRAEVLLLRMKDIARSGRKWFVVNKHAYSAVIDVIAKNKAPGTESKALALLREMQALAKDGAPDVAPNVLAYNSVITAFANQGNFSQARALLNEMIDEVGRGNDAVSPNTVTYGAVMNAHAMSRSPEGSRGAIQLLEMMETEHAEDKTKPKPSVYAYTRAIDALAHSDESVHAPELAEALLMRMRDDFNAGLAEEPPNLYCLCAVLRVWNAHGKSKAPARAESLIEWAEVESKKGNHTIKPDRSCYNILLEILAKSRKDNSLTRIYNILRSMSTSEDEGMKPDAQSYIRLMTGIHRVRTRKAPTEQLGILNFLLEEYAKGTERLKPTSRVVNLVLMTCMKKYSSASDIENTRIVLDEVGRIIIGAEEYVLSASTFKLYFDACNKLAYGNASLIEEIYSLSKKTRKWDSTVEGAYRALHTIT